MALLKTEPTQAEEVAIEELTGLKQKYKDLEKRYIVSEGNDFRKQAFY